MARNQSRQPCILLSAIPAPLSASYGPGEILKDAQIVESVRRWVQLLVVDMNLCPFAKRELVKNRVRFSVTDATNEKQLLSSLRKELALLDRDPSVETTLLIHPQALQEIFDYNRFLVSADRLLVKLELEGIYQIAGFHPGYQFAGTDHDDVENYTNRSPYPMMHILREDSLERAIAEYPDVARIPVRNIELMNSLGQNKLKALLQACLTDEKQYNG